MGVPVVVSDAVIVDGAQLGREISLLSGQINAANHRLLRMIAEFDARGGWKKGGVMRSCAHWLAANCGMAMGAAREKVRVARCLAGLPEVEEGFASGDLSYSKVRAITRVATPENQGFLVTMAERTSASHLEKLVGKYQPVEEPAVAALRESGGLLPLPGGSDGSAAKVSGSGIDEEERRENSREMYWFQDEDGMWVIHAKLPPEQGHLVMKALEAITRPIQEERQDEWKAQQKARMQAVARNIMQRQREAQGEVEGFVEECVEGDVRSDEDWLRRAAGERAGPSARVEYERADEKISAETYSQFMNQTRADAFVDMVEHFLATSPDYRQLQGLKGAERCQVVLHVDVNTLREQRSGVCCVHGSSHYEDKPWLSPDTARRLGCDATLVTVLDGEKGEVLNVGRRSRVVPASIRRALQERDGCCRYPGCHESSYIDAHHIQHWADGGETSLENLVTLCRFHHRQLHRGCFDVVLDDVSAEISIVEGERASSGASDGPR